MDEKQLREALLVAKQAEKKPETIPLAAILLLAKGFQALYAEKGEFW